MDSSSFEGFVLDPSKCSKLSIEEKRELVYELSKCENGTPELLHSWSRQEILKILCAETGKERKYTGLTKLNIIENLLKVVSEKNGSVTDHEPQPLSATGPRTARRQRKNDHPNRLPVASDSSSINPVNNNSGNIVYCKNSACRAKLSPEDIFCKRCSCCICHQYDDNKDPSLWLTCSSEPPFQGESCGMSCHLECALKQEKSGIAKDKQDKGLDGCFYCLSCGKVNDLLGCWRKQMITARDTRRVDILCYRVSLSQKLLTGTRHYQQLYVIADEAIKKLEADLGPLSGLPVKMVRGIVNRLSSGPEVQRLCSSAVESLDLMLSGTGSNIASIPVVQDSSHIAPCIRFEDVCTSSVTVIVSTEVLSLRKVSDCTMWHRKADDMDYQAEPTCALFEPSARFSISGLSPATNYFFKAVFFDENMNSRTLEVQMQTCSEGVPKPKGSEMERRRSPATNCSSLSNPFVEDENNNVSSYRNENKNQKSDYVPYCKTSDNINTMDLSTDGFDCTGPSQGGSNRDLASMLDEDHAMAKNIFTTNSVNLEDKHSSEGKTVEERSPENGSSALVQSGMECLPFHISEAGQPNTPCKLEKFKDGLVRSTRPKLDKYLNNGYGKEVEPQERSSVKKRNAERQGEKCTENGEKDFGYYVKVVRWLECDGHIETSFRQKFLTWYSLRASPEEVRVVKVFVDTLMEDPSSLAEQLVDTFSEVISSKRSSVVPTGFCVKLWH